MAIPWSRSSASVGTVTLDKAGLATDVLQNNILAKVNLLGTEVKQNDIITELQAIKLATQLNIWDKIAGNNKLISYFSGVAAGNPSGNVENIQTIQFRTGTTVIITQTFVYNAADNVLSITAT